MPFHVPFAFRGRAPRCFSAVFVPFASLLAIACGAPAGDEEATPSATSASVLSFQEWCGQWGLSGCPSNALELSRAEDPWNASQWRAAFGVAQALMQSPSRVTVTRAQMQDANLSSAMRLLGLDSRHKALLDRMDKQEMEALELGGGKTTLRSKQESDLDAPSGLHVHADATLEFSIEGTQARVRGLRLSSRDASLADDVVSFNVNSANAATLSMAKEEVTGVPLAFIRSDVLLFGGAAPKPGKPPADRLFAAIPYLKSWLVSGQRDLSLNAGVMDAASRAVAVFGNDASKRQNLQAVLRAVDTLVSRSDTRGRALVQGTLRRGLRCMTSDGKNEINLKSQFGLRDVRALGQGVTLDLYGVSITGKFGPFKRTFEPQRIDVSSSKIVIYNVPVVGSVTIDLKQQQESSLNCG